MSIKMRQEAISGFPLLIIEGRIDANAVVVMESKLSEFLSKGEKKILIDLGQVAYLSSTGMRLLLSVSKQLKEREGELMLYALKDEVHEIIKMAGFEKILSIYPSKKAVIATL
ncbi:MAG: STAS domain-containing protein [Simkaniaceae bacterium]